MIYVKELEKKGFFIPTTMERKIAKDIVFRPIRSWHSNTYAGEQLETMPDSEDRSGCMDIVERRGYKTRMCSIPLTVIHRIYWHKKNPKLTVSAFLSYPDAMGFSNKKYFWEVYSVRKDGDIERFFGKDAEKKMEAKIIRFLRRAYAKQKR
jgi:hypothetical protein